MQDATPGLGQHRAGADPLHRPPRPKLDAPCRGFQQILSLGHHLLPQGFIKEAPTVCHTLAPIVGKPRQIRPCPGEVHSPPASPKAAVPPDPNSLLLLVLTGSLEASVQLVNVDLVQTLLL